MLEDYQISDTVRYENHRLVAGEVKIGGVLGAALLCAMLVDTEEGARRGIAMDSEAEKRAWISRYEREVRRDEWGLLSREVELLSEAYIELATSQTKWTDICPNIRLLDLARGTMMSYMRHLTTEYFGSHIWECHPWSAPFAQWLYDAVYTETRRQRFLQTDWTDEALVTALEDSMHKTGTDTPTLFFEGEAAADILNRYYKWMWTTFRAALSEMPGAQPRAAKHRNYLYEQETDWTFLADDIAGWDDEQQRWWAEWMVDWQKYCTKRLKPEKPVLFWESAVSETRQQQLIQFLRIQEKEWDYFKCLSAAIYALRQMGYVRRACSVRDITRWMSEHLSKDYTLKNNHDQFVRAWKELGRYTEEVKYFVELLEEHGVGRSER